MAEDERTDLEQHVDEQEKRADEARERAGEAAAEERVEAQVEDYGGEPPEREPDDTTPPAIRQ
jgi:hypothetical protein